MAGNGPLTVEDLAPGDVLETYDIVFVRSAKSFINWDVPLSLLTTRNSAGYSPPAPKEHITVVAILIGSGPISRRAVVMHQGRLAMLFLTSDNSLKKVCS